MEDSELRFTTEDMKSERDSVYSSNFLTHTKSE